MKKIILLLLSVSLLLVSCGGNDSIKDNVKNPVVEIKNEIKADFKDLSEYIDSELSEDKIEELNNILSQRKEIQTEIGGLIKKSTSETKDEVYATIVEKRATCAGRILPFVSEEQKTNFSEYCENANAVIKKTLDK